MCTYIHTSIHTFICTHTYTHPCMHAYIHRSIHVPIVVPASENYSLLTLFVRGARHVNANRSLPEGSRAVVARF